MTLPNLYLRRRHERRLQRGHPWVFSNEVDMERSPMMAFQAGDCVNVSSYSGKVLGTAYVNPHSLICARLLSPEADRVLDEELLGERVVAIEEGEESRAQGRIDLPFTRSGGGGTLLEPAPWKPLETLRRHP